MRVWCVSREAAESLVFDLETEKPPRMLAIPENINGHQRLREYELLNNADEEAVYLETAESAERIHLAA